MRKVYEGFTRGVLATSILAVLFGAHALIVPPAGAQAVFSVRGTPQYPNPASFGRQVSFDIFISTPNFGCNNGNFLTLSNTSLSVNFPPGVDFASAKQGNATVSGSPATGEQMTLDLGTINNIECAAFFNGLFLVNIQSSVPDGATLQAGLGLSAIPQGSTSAQTASGSVSFQVGYLPIAAYITSYEATGQGKVEFGTSFSFGSATGTGGQPMSGSATLSLPVQVGSVLYPFGLAGTVEGATDQLVPNLPAPGASVKVGDITGPGSLLFVGGLGTRVSAYGGFLVTGDLTSAISVDADPSTLVASPEVTFSNPNPYPVTLQLDVRIYAHAVASNAAARDPISGAPFGFPGSASAGYGGYAASASGGVQGDIESQRFLLSPSGSSLHLTGARSCFPNTAVSGCSDSSVNTTTACFSTLCPFPGGVVVPANASTTLPLNVFSLEGSAQANSNIAFDATTGLASVIRTGYGNASASESIRIMRGDANLGVLLAGTPAKLTISGGSPIELMVSDAQGHRTGFLAPATAPSLPGTPAPNVDEQPSILTEIFGASYSGIDSHPQVIEVPDPQPGSYQVQVLGTGTGTFLLTTETLDINDTVIDNQSVSGAVSAGSSSSFTFNVDEKGHVTMSGGTGSGTPPTTMGSLSPLPNGAGWDNSNVTVTLTATASATGATVKQISYSATGAQAIPSTTVSGSSATIGISNEGVTTLNFFATDSAGNIETAKNVPIRLDKTPPSINCGAPDGLWHATDVSIACTAGDSGSGLANAADASFSLSTSVPAGTETANAATGTHPVCDVAGNCAAAGPIVGNMVDKKPPSINVSSPTNGANYLLNQSVNANYTCTDGGSGVVTCTGTVASGSAIDTASVGSKNFTVNAADKVGNAASPQSVTYSIGYGVCLLYDPTRAVQSGSTISLKIQLCDANNADVSGSGVVVHGVSLVQTSTSASEVLQASGNANPDNDFRFDSTLGPTGGYIFNLSTKGLTTGSYLLTFTAGADPLPHILSFQVR